MENALLPGYRKGRVVGKELPNPHFPVVSGICNHISGSLLLLCSSDGISYTASLINFLNDYMFAYTTVHCSIATFVCRCH